LSALFPQRGFAVLMNRQPPVKNREAGEVDLIAVRAGHLLKKVDAASGTSAQDDAEGRPIAARAPEPQ